MASLGLNVEMISFIGNDHSGDLIIDNLSNFGVNINGIIRIENYNTTIKTRILGANQQMIRIDDEMK